MAKETFSSLIDLFKTSSSSTVSTLVCEICGTKLSVFRKKKPCLECKKQFCSQCLLRGRDRTLHCKNCYILCMRPPLRSALLNLRIKDLQHYLNQHNVSTRGCLEKEDLVNVVLRYASNPGNPNSGNPGFPSGSSSYAPAGNSRNIQHENATSPPASYPASSSGPSNTTPLSSAPGEEHSRPQPDSDSSSSDTSFEMVPRPSSNENIAGAHSSSTSTSSSSPSPVSDTEPGITVDVPAQPQEENPNAALNLASLSAESPLNSAAGASEAAQGSERHNETHLETLEVNPQQSISQSSSSNNSPNLIRGTMSSITSETDFEALSVKQLKDILHRHRVNYHGCCEKAELVERAKRLYRDYLASRAELEKLDLDALCKICMDAPVECVMLECGHMATCTDCGRQLSECPICRQFVVRIVRTFKA
ncbi:E3 ubiquitin-protein ligase rififylin isoform X2 [Thrips palmi]|uniref:E3 ubiquitin-protein ligase rififylin isoform X2 n=1 Tax=Thrips palmi TaxID=161013 RepID=A0A6P8ZGL9_THRPL|nr:E3 ubiquitin-protein ligase rififylin isoform X2 [Thrips palmi]